jgi:hypothetical protein
MTLVRQSHPFQIARSSRNDAVPLRLLSCRPSTFSTFSTSKLDLRQTVHRTLVTLGCRVYTGQQLLLLEEARALTSSTHVPPLGELDILLDANSNLGVIPNRIFRLA